MKRLVAVASLSLLASGSVRAGQAGQAVDAPKIVITRSGTRPSRPAPVENFTGSVRVERLFEAAGPPHAGGASVTFEPGARTAWHTHPAGQILIVTAGVGRVQGGKGPIEEIRAGDVVWTPPGLKHWHGASPTAAMTHIAMTEPLGGKTADWMEKVSDAEYGAPVAPRGSAGGPVGRN